jgi:hypothetical protein
MSRFRISSRETVLLLATGIAVLFGVSLLVARPYSPEWRDLRARAAELRRQIRVEKEMIASRGHWAARLDELSVLLPEFPADAKMDIHWLTVMDSMAQKNSVKIVQRQAGEERRMGDVYEMTIECRSWEGSLAAMVRFLFDLQSEGGMLDVRQLQVRPKAGTELRGRFSLHCAYTRAK